MNVRARVPEWMACAAALVLAGAGAAAAGPGSASDGGTAKSAPAKVAKGDAEKSPTAQDETMKLEGGAEGTVFRSLTVTGEDRIRIEFERPELKMDLDPRTAPGLEWGDPAAILREPAVDLVDPLVAASARADEPYFPSPWIDRFRTGDLARFHPELEGVDEWRLTVVDSRSDTVTVFAGRGNPPREIGWDGTSRDGTPVPPGVTCSYVLDATDRAGNHRTFVGEGFRLPAYRAAGEDGATSFLFPGEALGSAAAQDPPLLVEVAGRLGRVRPAGGPVEVKVTAAAFSEAQALAGKIADFLKARSLGDPARIRAIADVRPDAPPGGTVAITVRPASPTPATAAGADASTEDDAVTRDSAP